MGRDFYAAFTFDLPSLPAIKRLRRSEFGARGVLAYYELRLAVAQAYQYGQHVEIDDALAMAGDWEMDEEQVARMLALMADIRLIDPSLFVEANVIGIKEIAERQQYVQKRSECGKMGGRPKKTKAES